MPSSDFINIKAYHIGADSSTADLRPGCSHQISKPELPTAWQNDPTPEKVFQNTNGTSKDSKPLVQRTTARLATTIRNIIGSGQVQRRSIATIALFHYGFMPLICYFSFVYRLFTTIPIRCSQSFDYYNERDDMFGLAGLFTIDRVKGRFPFWLAKLLDTIWDLFVARGMQFVAGWACYVVFSAALLRTIEVTPIPYRTFTGISLDGPSIWAVVGLCRDLMRHSTKKATFLFAYAAFAFLYALAMPTLISTMTGYVSSSFAYVMLPDTSQHVPSDMFHKCLMFEGLPDINGSANLLEKDLSVAKARSVTRAAKCNDTITVPINNYTFPIDIIDRYPNTEAVCYSGNGYSDKDVKENERCLPDSEKHAAYRWGFSAKLTSLVLILHAVWSLALYLIWSEVEHYSQLRREGYVLNPLRGVIALPAAAQGTTGLDDAGLRFWPLKGVEERLYARDAAVRCDAFMNALPFPRTV
ncbi:uncharacterized protein K452DRAFT_308654 [Aplosporella prunicola CBS 121167]|uniref:Uncharacterized protein n=1 Tax=Aplosporella prunicola CBS 121167 TaxID=1176127 RepID=A0A6A6BBE1_9PEZI|nr:uncharacterized protein K452DRAFT_308654 [Aplosporella prunicola CBS 121167]KAF2141552.1 hypothetical protein K452DRAFT_308654 [Aplosporella prunicola CBS 121167]